MKKIIDIKKAKKLFTGAMVTLTLGVSNIYAASNTESIDSFINFACDWLTKIRRRSSTCWGCNVCTRLATRGC